MMERSMVAIRAPTPRASALQAMYKPATKSNDQHQAREHSELVYPEFDIRGAPSDKLELVRAAAAGVPF